ncbi:hypothetical protein QTP70_005170 [Hemibagrus guttatus]|uniref:Uncharacterized protein n=1 Tax=Hemibagrus guttatus TaxID=175788 RepID=A0AAE0RAC9_9TELE|nr:hypothetical protein QTP70_005170 [Hemibagrus guttatus]
MTAGGSERFDSLRLLGDDGELLGAVDDGLGGCGILGVGVWLSVTQGNFATLSTSLPSLSAANLLIAMGTIIMVIGCLGCVGAVKESRPLLLSVIYLKREHKLR